MRSFLLILFICMPQSAITENELIRRFEFNYRFLAGEFPSHKAVDIYIPMPVVNGSQRIMSTQFRSSFAGKEGVESTHGNRYFHIHRPANLNGPIDAEFTWVVERKMLTDDPQALSEKDRQRYLAPNNLVPVGHKILDPIRTEIHSSRADQSAIATARAIYDWVVENIEYKKIGGGWGNGDTFWVSNQRMGNCTDFHALFISLARSEGIPARFEIGFRIPLSMAGGSINNYHCWAQFYLPERGWVPVDAAEAAQHPELKEMRYGYLPADRIHVSTGRDIVLSPAGEYQALNFFIYPHVEVGGVPWKVNLKTEFSYRASN